MQRFLILLLLSFTFFHAGAQQSYSLTGMVKDRKGQPLPGAGVYVSGYKIATSTNNDGKYTLELKPGNYDILIQIIGFKATNKNVVIMDKNVRLDIELDESAIQLNEVNIRPDKDRQMYINIFKDFFIGNTPNSLSCKILNPDVLMIDYQDNVLNVKTNEFLIIENKALGYRIKYLINDFTYDYKSRIVYYEGYPYYEDLKGSPSKIRQWNKKRRVAYNGSAQHFFRALFQNRVKEEGFIIQKMKRMSADEHLTDSTLKLEEVNLTAQRKVYGASPSINFKPKTKGQQVAILNQGLILTDTLVHTYNESIKSINFTDILYVVYSGENEDPEYVSIPGRSISRPLNLFDYQVSLINLLISPIYFYENGSAYNPRSMLFEGYWGWEKVADSLPSDYIPN